MAARECPLPHVDPGCVSTPMSELIELQARLARAEAVATSAQDRIDAAERREAEAINERRAAENRIHAAEERASQAEQNRAAAFMEAARERERLFGAQDERKSGIIEENRALGGTVTRLLAENESLTKRVSTALDELDRVRRAHAELSASRPSVQIEADKAARELERARVEAGVRAKEIESNHDLASMLLTGLGSALLPMSEKVLARVIEDKFPRTLQAASEPPPQPKSAGDKAPLEVWTELLVECWQSLSPTSRLQAAFALAESRWLNVLLVPDTHPIFARMREEVGFQKIRKLAQMTYAMTGISPSAGDTKPEQPAQAKGNGAAATGGKTSDNNLG